MAKKQEQNKRRTRGLLRWIMVLVVLALLALLFYKYIKKEAIRNPIPGDYFSAQSRDHIPLNQDHPGYNSNPPTGGWHHAQPAQTGIYDKEFPDETLVHNLEHSHIWIAYKPDLSAEQIEKLVDIAKDYGSKIIMTPRSANDSPIALVAWEHLLKMDAVDELAAREFIEAYRGIAGPEKLLDSGFKDFRGSDDASQSGESME